MAALIEAGIQSTAIINKFNNQDLGFNVVQTATGVSPKLKATDFTNTTYMHYPYGSVQLAHHLTYLRNEQGQVVEDQVNLTQNFDVTNAVSIIRSSNIMAKTKFKLEIDFGCYTDDSVLGGGGLFDFQYYAFGTSLPYKICDTFITFLNYQYPRFDDKIDFMYTYKGNSRDGKNWFLNDQSLTVQGETVTRPILTYLPYEVNPYSNVISGFSSLNLYVRGKVGNDYVNVGYIRPAIWLTKNNHIRVTYLLIRTHNSFDYDNGEYFMNILELIANASGLEAMFNNGNPIFTMAIIPA